MQPCTHRNYFPNVPHFLDCPHQNKIILANGNKRIEIIVRRLRRKAKIRHIVSKIGNYTFDHIATNISICRNTMSVRHDWYQSETKVVVTVMLKNAVEKNYKVDIERERLHITADGYELDVPLFHAVNVANSSHKAYSTKVEITLAKEVGERWDSLEKKSLPPPTAAPPPIHKKNWDNFAKEVEKSEEEEAKNEEALQRLFKKIYSTSSPEVQKAMNKSFSESGGTVLSTNWQEVSKDKVEVKPPEGVEFRKWD